MKPSIAKLAPVIVRAKVGLELYSKRFAPKASLLPGQIATLVGVVANPREHRGYVQLLIGKKKYLALASLLERIKGDENGT